MTRFRLERERDEKHHAAFRSFNTKRGHIRKVRFAPGKGNFRAFVLFNDGVDIWDVKDVSRHLRPMALSTINPRLLLARSYQQSEIST